MSAPDSSILQKISEQDRLIIRRQIIDLNTAKPNEKYKVISSCLRADPTVSIRMLCMGLGVSRSGYYRWKNAEEHRITMFQEEMLLTDQILMVQSNDTYIPYRQIAKQVNDIRIAKGDKKVSESKIYRILQMYRLD